MIDGVKKIAVLRANGLGDLIFVLPALDALRQTYPQAKIVYLGSEWHVRFIQGRVPSVDRAEIIPQTDGVLIEAEKEVNPREQRAFFERMQSEHFDLAFQMHGGGRYSNPFTRRLHAHLTFGAKSEDAEPLDFTIPYIFYQHEILRNLEIAALAGAVPTHLNPRLPVLSSDLEQVQPLLAKLGQHFVVIHPGSTDGRRRWSPAGYARVADDLTAAGFQVALSGGEDEVDLTKQVAEAMHQPVINLCGMLTMDGLIGLVSQADLVITNNTGPLHLTLAVGGKAVGLFFAESVINALPLMRASYYPLIAWDRHCPLCGTFCDKAELDAPQGNSCSHNASFLNEITPEMVTQAAMIMLRSA